MLNYFLSLNGSTIALAHKLNSLFRPSKKTDCGFFLSMLEAGDAEYSERLGEKEAHLLKWTEYMKEDEVIYDIGGARGIAAMIVATRLNKKCKLFSFESNTWAIKEMQRNLVLNGMLGCVFPINAALSQEVAVTSAGFSKILSDYSAVGACLPGFRRGEEHRPHESVVRIYFPVFSVDALVSNGWLPQPAHVKIDVDGAEILVLNGMKDTLSKLKSLCIEWVDSDKEVAAVITELSGSGFDIVFKKTNEPDLTVDGVKGNNCDVVLVKRELLGA